MTLVWGVRKEGPKESLERAKILFQNFERDKSQIIVPSIVVAEYLTAVDVNKRFDVAAAIGARFLVMPFDIKCTALAANLFSDGKSGRPMSQPNARVCLRADSMIVATAKIHGAKVFYSHDKNCRSMAKNAGMDPWDLPTHVENLFPSPDPSEE
jgi:predicted nucleic acid-binding protein